MWNKNGFWFSAVMTLLLFLLGLDSLLMNNLATTAILKELGAEAYLKMKLSGGGLAFGSIWLLRFIVVVLCFIYAPNALFKIIYPILTILFALLAFFLIPYPELSLFIPRETALFFFSGLTNLWTLVGIVFIWGYANSKFKLREASYYYYLWGAFAALLGYFVGEWGLGYWQDWLSSDITNGIAVPAIVLALSLLILGLFWWLDSNVSDEVSNEVHSITTLSPRFFLYAFSLLMLLVGYGFSATLLEIVWKTKVKLNFNDEAAYENFVNLYGNLGLWDSIIIATLIAAFLLIFRKAIPWNRAALATPWALLLVGLVFFTSLFFGEALQLPALFNSTQLDIVVYSLLYLFFIPQAFHSLLFGPSTSMAFIPFSYQVRFGLLALFIIIFAGVGKLLGSITLQLLLLYFGTLQTAEPFIALLFFVSVLIWIIAVAYLNKYIKRHEDIE